MMVHFLVMWKFMWQLSWQSHQWWSSVHFFTIEVVVHVTNGYQKNDVHGGMVRLLQDHGITRLGLYDADHSVLRALRNMSIHVSVGIHDPAEVEDLGNARLWVERNVVPFAEHITAIAVGEDDERVMRNLRDALAGREIEVASARDVVADASLTPDQEQRWFVSEQRRRLADDRGFVWCVVRRESDVEAVQSALNWTCGRVDCDPIKVGGRCFLFNTIWDHASWAYNAYYNSMNGAQGACNFLGTAYVTGSDPSSQQCFYQGTNRALAVESAAGQTAMDTLAVSLVAFVLVLVVL